MATNTGIVGSTRTAPSNAKQLQVLSHELAQLKKLSDKTDGEIKHVGAKFAKLEKAGWKAGGNGERQKLLAELQGLMMKQDQTRALMGVVAGQIGNISKADRDLARQLR